MDASLVLPRIEQFGAYLDSRIPRTVTPFEWSFARTGTGIVKLAISR